METKLIEMCRCGHINKIHGNTVAPNHGECFNADCHCEKFTFRGYY